MIMLSLIGMLTQVPLADVATVKLDLAMILIAAAADLSYVETDDEDFCGHVRIVAAILDRHRLEIRDGTKTIEVTFAVSEEVFQELAKILPILAPKVRIVHRPG